MPRLAAMARRQQPGLIVVDRTVGGRYENYRTPEQEVPDKPLPYVWESCLTMGDQWSYKPNDKYKSTRTLIHLLVDIVSKGGNFLLNVGPGRRRPVSAGRPAAAARDRPLDARQFRGDLRHAADRALQGRPRLLHPQGAHDLPHRVGREERNGPAGPGEGRPGSSRRSKSSMLGAADPLAWSTNDAEGLAVEIPESIRRSPPCDHAWTLAVQTE